jgi:hypothetical protein
VYPDLDHADLDVDGVDQPSPVAWRSRRMAFAISALEEAPGARGAREPRRRDPEDRSCGPGVSGR